MTPSNKYKIILCVLLLCLMLMTTLRMNLLKTSEKLPNVINLNSASSTVSVVHIPLAQKIKITTLNTKSLAYELCNPGNLRFARQPGAINHRSGFAHFSDMDSGYRALIRQIKKDQSRHLTLRQFLYKFSPPKENDTEWYIRQLTKPLKCKPHTRIDTLSTEDIAREVMWIESRSFIETK